MWYEITYPFPNFNGATVEMWKLISNIIPHFTIHLNIHPCWPGRKWPWPHSQWTWLQRPVFDSRRLEWLLQLPRDLSLQVLSSWISSRCIHLSWCRSQLVWQTKGTVTNTTYTVTFFSKFANINCKVRVILSHKQSVWPFADIWRQTIIGIHNDSLHWRKYASPVTRLIYVTPSCESGLI